MIHPDDIILDGATATTYLVTRLGSRDIQCVNRLIGSEYMYPEVDEMTLEIKDSARWSLVECPHTVKPTAVTDFAFDRSMAMAKNTGIMESAIASANLAFQHLSGSHVASHPEKVVERAIQARASLIRAAESLEDLPSVSGTPSVPWLKTHLS